MTHPLDDMKLHESIHVFTKYTEHYVTRVSGGWIYVTYTSTGLSSVFVPYNNEIFIGE